MPELETEKEAGLNSCNMENNSGADIEEVHRVKPSLVGIKDSDKKAVYDVGKVELRTSSNSDISIGATDLSSQEMSQQQDTSSAQLENSDMGCLCESSDYQSVNHKELDSFTNRSQTNKSIEASLSGRSQTDDFSFGDTESESVADTSRISGSDSLSACMKPLKIKRKSKKAKSLKIVRDGRDSDSSVSSKKKGASRKIIVKCKFSPDGLKYIEDSLRGHIFSGWVDERKWMENLGSYRDIVEVDEWEVELNKQLNVIVRKIPGVQEGTKWINITPPSATEPSYCLWVFLDAAPIPGHYWFVITGVSVQSQFGLKISLRIIRNIHPQDYEDCDARKKRKNFLSSGESGHEIEAISQQLIDWWDQAKQLNFAMVWSALAGTLTLHNIREAIRFVVILVVTLTVGLMTFFKEAHHVMLRFIREAGIFLHHVTPFMQSLISFIEKIIGGMYLLIAMVYRDWRRTSPPPTSVPPPSYQVPRQVPLPLTQGQGFPPSPPAPGPRVVKYVGPQQWVYKRQNSSPPMD